MAGAYHMGLERYCNEYPSVLNLGKLVVQKNAMTVGLESKNKEIYDLTMY
jgi:hypothetical protein